jgi:hypothetical protein
MDSGACQIRLVTWNFLHFQRERISSPIESLSGFSEGHGKGAHSGAIIQRQR